MNEKKRVARKQLFDRERTSNVAIAIEKRAAELRKLSRAADGPVPVDGAQMLKRALKWIDSFAANLAKAVREERARESVI